MNKRELIDAITGINRSAQPAFLALFSDEELGEYLAHLRRVDAPRLTGDAARYERYFRKPRTAAERTAAPDRASASRPLATVASRDGDGRQIASATARATASAAPFADAPAPASAGPALL
ncbi:MAG: hypothetical protein ACOC8F_01550 [Planctomycetota bacterium]